MNRVVPTLLLLSTLAALSHPATGFAQESILAFHSDIQVLQNADLLVTETIRVRSEGTEIRRGIFRDFPTRYQDRGGRRHQVGFEVLDVRRGDHVEPYRTEARANGVRIYVGDPDVFLQPGVYSYRLSYRTDRQLGFFADHDELYWNVTGNDWAFPIEQASARVTLPAAVPPDRIRAEGYTGRAGQNAQDYRTEVGPGGGVIFETTRELAPREGLTIVVTWPKGHVEEPTGGDAIRWFLGDHREAFGGLLGLGILLVYLLYSWNKVGRDPPRGIIIPRYRPPKRYSPGALRYIRNMGYDDKTFAAALVNLAVKGYVRIEESAAGIFTLRKLGQPVELAEGERALASSLFAGPGHQIRLEQDNHKVLRKAKEAHRQSLQRAYEKTHFLTNRRHLIPGLVISLVTLVCAVLLLPNTELRATAGFLLLWLSIWSIGVAFLLLNAIALWRGARSSGGIGKALIASLFATPFVAGEIVALWVLSSEVSASLALVALAILVLNLSFYQWLKKPTRLGRQILDASEGLRLYLSVAEQEELHFRHPPERTPELFERLLPFALALDVEQQWAEKFSAILQQAQTGDSGYRPAWYQGDSWSPGRTGRFAGTLGAAMSSAIAASSTAPGSSSGSGGGGSSGGGGGGGGGGGW